MLNRLFCGIPPLQKHTLLIQTCLVKQVFVLCCSLGLTYVLSFNPLKENLNFHFLRKLLLHFDFKVYFYFQVKLLWFQLLRKVYGCFTHRRSRKSTQHGHRCSPIVNELVQQLFILKFKINLRSKFSIIQKSYVLRSFIKFHQVILYIKICIYLQTIYYTWRISYFLCEHMYLFIYELFIIHGE